MDIEIAKHDRMSESGSSLLRLIQNQDIPLLDLLVRESVQNSLDASIEKTNPVKVDFTIGKFCSKDANAHFDRITSKLDSKYAGFKDGLCDYVSIRDCGTCGLTGPVRYSDVERNQYGNLLKLIYEICKPQQNEGAGGSWGLGKTVYFRVGIGLVIYYSRICVNGVYSERMAACMVEDETKRDSIIPENGNLKRGIAWWGKTDTDEHTVPLENSPEIHNILQTFNCKPYQDEETGTTIIIPYINQEKLLNEVYAKNEEDADRPYWTRSIESYLNIAVQKWYAPRLNNKKYRYGAYLVPSINGIEIQPNDMLPVFKIIRLLYIASITNSSTIQYDDDEIEINNENVYLRNVLSKTGNAGTITSVKLTDNQLHMLPPNNCKSPYQQITNSIVNMESGNNPLIMYTRRPGLIVGYDYNGIWTHSMTKSSAGTYIIGLFVLNSENVLKDEYSGISLEEYIRKGEKADHAAWADQNIKGNNPRIVLNIQRGLIKKINSKYKEKVIDTTEKKSIGLSHALADILLPNENFGKTASQKSHGGNSGSGTRKNVKYTSFTLTSEPIFKDGMLSYEYELFTKTNACEIALEVIADTQKLNADLWESENHVNTEFPLSIVDFSISSSRSITSDTTTIRNISIKGSCADDNISVKEIRSKIYSVTGTVQVTSDTPNILLTGKISIKSDAPFFRIAFRIKEI